MSQSPDRRTPQSGWSYHPQPYAAVPARRRGSGRLVALVAGGAGLLLVLLVVGGVMLLRSGTAAACGGGGAAPPDSATAPEYPARIELASTVAGLSKVDGNATVDEFTRTLAQVMGSDHNADTAVTAFYQPTGEVCQSKGVALFAATAQITNPTARLDGLFTGSGFTVIVNVQSFDPGPLKGYMKCGYTEADATPMSLCGAADAGSLISAAFLHRSPAESAPLFRQIREAILKRG